MAEFDMSSMNDLPGNSKSSKKINKAEQPRMKAVVSSSKLVNGGKKTLGQKFMSLFIPEDVKDIKRYLAEDVIIPGVKGLILDTIAMMFFNETYTGRRGSIFNSSSAPRRTYGGITNGKPNNTYSSRSSSSNRRDAYVNDDRDRVDYRDIVLSNREDAEIIITQMCDSISQYGQVSIGDLYSLIDITPKHTDFDWGWTDQRCINLRRVSNGFLIKVEDARFLE